MGDLTSTQMQTELVRRVSQLSQGAGSAALDAINRAIRWINRQGSYTFQLVADGATLTVPISPAKVNAPSDLDPGKALLISNVTNGAGLPIVKGSITDLWETRNFSGGIADDGFDRYLLVASASSAVPSVFHFFPSQSAQADVLVRYHKLTVDLADGAVKSNLPRDFDDLVIDMAEAEERRINDIGDTWNQMYARCQDQIKLLLNAYKSETILPGLETEAAELNQEKTQVGRP